MCYYFDKTKLSETTVLNKAVVSDSFFLSETTVLNKASYVRSAMNFFSSAKLRFQVLEYYMALICIISVTVVSFQSQLRL